MRAGRMIHTITLERRSSGQDSTGQPVDTWATLATVRADIQPIKGNEYFAGSGERADITHRSRIWYQAALSTLSAGDRAVFGSRIFDIEGALNPDERNREIHLMCIDHGNATT